MLGLLLHSRFWPQLFFGGTLTGRRVCRALPCAYSAGPQDHGHAEHASRGWDQLFAALPPQSEQVNELHFSHTKKCKSLFDHLSRLQSVSLTCGFLYLSHRPDSRMTTRCFAEISPGSNALLRLWSGQDHEELYNEISLAQALVYAHADQSSAPADQPDQCFCIVAPNAQDEGPGRNTSARIRR